MTASEFNFSLLFMLLVAIFCLVIKIITNKKLREKENEIKIQQEKYEKRQQIALQKISDLQEKKEKLVRMKEEKLRAKEEKAIADKIKKLEYKRMRRKKAIERKKERKKENTN